MYASEIAQREPERLAAVLAGTGDQWTYAEFEAAANRVAHAIRDAGLGEGDRIAIVMSNRLEMLAVQAAAERTGLYHVPINWHLTTAEISWIVNDSGARIVVSERKVLESVAPLPALCAGVDSWVMLGASPEDAPFVEFESWVAGKPTTHVPDERTGRPLPYSSGTTGKPKGILRPLPGTDPSEPVPIEGVAQVVYQFRDGMVFLEPAPMYHGAAHSHLGSALRMGGTSIVMDRFKAEAMLQLIEAHRVTHVAVVPTMFSRILQLPDDVREGYDVSSLEAVIHGAAPCPPTVKQQMIDWLGPILHENFGSTEGNGATTCDSHEWLERPGTVGRPIFGEPVILDAEGNELPIGEVGEIWWRGETDFTYVGDAAQTAEARVDHTGPLSTVGDVGYLDEDGYLYPTDRASFVIIRGGVNIYPQEIENVLVEHPAVADAAVFGIPHEDLGESVQGLVELKTGFEPTPETEGELLQHCRDHLARFKVPSAIDFTVEMPRLDSGKVPKKLLRARYDTRAAAAT